MDSRFSATGVLALIRLRKLYTTLTEALFSLMKSVLRILVVAVLVVAVGIGLWYWKTRADEADDNQLVLYGNVDIRQVDLAVNDSERIAELFVKEGDVVEQGQKLAVLELDRFRYLVQQAEAALASQRQVVARLVAGSRPQEIEKAKADTAAAEASMIAAQQTLVRVKRLVEKKAYSQQDLDDAIAAADAAAARYRAAKAAMDLVIIGPRKEDIAEAKAQLKRLEAELALARHNLSDAVLYAPNRGIIQDRILEVGDMASPQSAVYTMALIDPMWVRAYVSEPDLGRVFEGMKAVVTTDSFPGKRYQAWVGFISPTAEFTPKPVETRELRTKLVYQVRVFVHNPSNELRLGMPATATIRLDQSRATRGTPATHPQSTDSQATGDHAPDDRAPKSQK